MRIGAHPMRTLRRNGQDFGDWRTGLIEQFLRAVALQPVFEQLNCLKSFAMPAASRETCGYSSL
jgi:hypothetical protein